MGFRVHRSGKVSIRGRNFVKARRIVLRTKDNISERQAKRLSAYKGFFLASDCVMAWGKYDLYTAFNRAEKLISERSKRVKDAVVLDANDVKKIIAERFNVPEENVIKSQYSYTVITEKEDSNGKTEMERRDRKE